MIREPAVFIAGAVLFFAVVWDAFESIILPRRVTRKFRFTRFYYRLTWGAWKAVANAFPTKKQRETLLGFYGPISLLVLIGVWATGLVFSFGMMHYGAGSAVNVTGTGRGPSFFTDVYLSGTTFFTLGLGDVVPRTSFSRFLVVAEAGFGFGFLAAVIGYLPFIYGAFAERETEITLLDARAGTPPTAGELIRRHSYQHGHEALRDLLKDWENWSAQLMESHLSYPVLAYFRSQHDNQSWIASLTAILDTCALSISGMEGICVKQSELTFAIARHAVVDLSQVFSASPKQMPEDRLPPEELDRMRLVLAKHGTVLRNTPESNAKLLKLRRMYEPYVYALAKHLNQTLPPWLPLTKGKDNWQTTAWGQSTGMTINEGDVVHSEEHF